MSHYKDAVYEAPVCRDLRCPWHGLSRRMRLLEPAVQLRDGRVYVERTWRACWSLILAGHGYDREMVGPAREGFMLDNVKFVTRFTAATLARADGRRVSDPKRGLSDLDCSY